MPLLTNSELPFIFPEMEKESLSAFKEESPNESEKIIENEDIDIKLDEIKNDEEAKVTVDDLKENEGAGNDDEFSPSQSTENESKERSRVEVITEDDNDGLKLLQMKNLEEKSSQMEVINKDNSNDFELLQENLKETSNQIEENSSDESLLEGYEDNADLENKGNNADIENKDNTADLENKDSNSDLETNKESETNSIEIPISEEMMLEGEVLLSEMCTDENDQNSDEESDTPSRFRSEKRRTANKAFPYYSFDKPNLEAFVDSSRSKLKATVEEFVDSFQEGKKMKTNKDLTSSHRLYVGKNDDQDKIIVLDISMPTLPNRLSLPVKQSKSSLPSSYPGSKRAALVNRLLNEINQKKAVAFHKRHGLDAPETSSFALSEKSTIHEDIDLSEEKNESGSEDATVKSDLFEVEKPEEGEFSGEEPEDNGAEADSELSESEFGEEADTEDMKDEKTAEVEDLSAEESEADDGKCDSAPILQRKRMNVIDSDSEDDPMDGSRSQNKNTQYKSEFKRRKVVSESSSEGELDDSTPLGERENAYSEDVELENEAEENAELRESSRNVVDMDRTSEGLCASYENETFENVSQPDLKIGSNSQEDKELLNLLSGKFEDSEILSASPNYSESRHSDNENEIDEFNENSAMENIEQFLDDEAEISGEDSADEEIFDDEEKLKDLIDDTIINGECEEEEFAALHLKQQKKQDQDEINQITEQFIKDPDSLVDGGNKRTKVYSWQVSEDAKAEETKDSDEEEGEEEANFRLCESKIDSEDQVDLSITEETAQELRFKTSVMKFTVTSSCQKVKRFSLLTQENSSIDSDGVTVLKNKSLLKEGMNIPNRGSFTYRIENS